jgi:hypothetical protein
VIADEPEHLADERLGDACVSGDAQLFDELRDAFVRRVR